MSDKEKNDCSEASEDGVSKPPVDIVQTMIGSLGKFQLFLLFNIFLNKFPVAFHQIGIVFLAPPVVYSCLSPPSSGASMHPCPCSEPVFNRSIFTETITMTWNLICEDKWLQDLTQTIFMFGILVGSVAFGTISDRFGRRKPLLGAVILQIASGVAASQAPEYWSFTVFRFLLGAATGGTMVVGYVLAMEYVGKEHRETVSALYQLPFNFGHLMLAGFGYFFRDWSTLQLALTLPSLVLLSYYWVIPESARWLLATGQTDQAVDRLKKTATMNKLPIDNIAHDVEIYQNIKSAEQKQKKTTIDLFRTPNIRKNTLCMAFNWLVCGFVYFGVTQYIGNLAGDIYVNVASSALITIPGTLLSIPLMKHMGRRSLMIATNVVSSLSLFAIAITPKNSIYQVILACIGDVGMFIAFIVIYLYASEIFPTVVRNAGIGLSSMSARVGTMMAPYVARMGHDIPWLPPVVFGLVPLIGAGVCLLMPETKGSQLLNTIEEGENLGKPNKNIESIAMTATQTKRLNS